MEPVNSWNLAGTPGSTRIKLSCQTISCHLERGSISVGQSHVWSENAACTEKLFSHSGAMISWLMLKIEPVCILSLNKDDNLRNFV